MKILKLCSIIGFIVMISFIQASQKRDGLFEETECYEMSFDRQEGQVTINNSVGRTVVTSWDRDFIVVEATKRASTQALLDNMRVDVYGDASKMSIKTCSLERHAEMQNNVTGRVFDGGIQNFVGGNYYANFTVSGNVTINGVRMTEYNSNQNSLFSQIDYIVHLPSFVTLKVESASGFVKVQKILNSISVKTKTGDIEIAETQGNIAAISMSGDVKISGKANSVDVKNVSGGITISGIAQSIIAQSISGDIRAKGYFDMVSASTISGNIGIDKAKQSQVSTVSGSKWVKQWNNDNYGK